MPKRGSGKLYELNGERHTLTEWCKLYGVPVQRTQGRISRGNYTLCEALTTPQENPIQSRRRKETNYKKSSLKMKKVKKMRRP